MRAVPEEADAAKHERCEFMPFLNPEKVFTSEDGKICAVEFHRFAQLYILYITIYYIVWLHFVKVILFRTEQDDDGNWIVDHDQTIKDHS